MPALDQGPFANVDELRASVAGMTRPEITSFLREDDFLNKADASALADLLVAPTGNYISISHLIILSSFELVSILTPSRSYLLFEIIPISWVTAICMPRYHHVNKLSPWFNFANTRIENYFCEITRTYEFFFLHCAFGIIPE